MRKSSEAGKCVEKIMRHTSLKLIYNSYEASTSLLSHIRKKEEENANLSNVPSDDFADPGSGAEACDTAESSYLPPWLQKSDQEVLRYYAYYKEPVFEGGDENRVTMRIRRFILHYFISLGKCMLKI